MHLVNDYPGSGKQAKKKSYPPLVGKVENRSNLDTNFSASHLLSDHRHYCLRGKASLQAKNDTFAEVILAYIDISAQISRAQISDKCANYLATHV